MDKETKIGCVLGALFLSVAAICFAGGMVTTATLLNSDTNYNVTLYDINGEQVMKYPVTADPWEDKCDCSNEFKQTWMETVPAPYMGNHTWLWELKCKCPTGYNDFGDDLND